MKMSVGWVTRNAPKAHRCADIIAVHDVQAIIAEGHDVYRKRCGTSNTPYAATTQGAVRNKLRTLHL
jgi:hypothetical protein